MANLLSLFQTGYRMFKGEALNNLVNILNGTNAFPSGITVTSGATINGGSAETNIHGYQAMLQVPISAVSSSAVATTIGVPTGATVTSLEFYTTTAFTGATVSGTLGSAASDASYVAATSVKSGGVVTFTPVGTTAAAAELLSVTSGGLVFTLEQGTPTATGSGTLVVGYAVP